MKLEIYFQSRASGGGECSVHPVGPGASDTFEVKFLEKADKENVLKKGEHKLLVDDKPVPIVLETIKKPEEDLRPRPPSLTQPAETPSSRPPSLTESLDDKIALGDKIHPSDGPVFNSVDSVVQKVSVDRGAGLLWGLLPLGVFRQCCAPGCTGKNEA